MEKRVFFSSILILLFGTLLASAISIAVLDFEPRGITEDEAVLITDILRTELLKTGRITIIEREKINALLKERQLSQIGVTESVELGKLLGVEKIIFGRIGKLGDSYVVTVRMIDVESGKVDFAEQYNCQITTESITSVMKEIAQVVQKYLPPIEGEIAIREGNTVYITLGNKDGVQPEMTLNVYRVKRIKDKEGRVVFEKALEIGKVKVTDVSEKGSRAEILQEKESIREGDMVKLPVPLHSKSKGKVQTSQQFSPPATGYLKITVENPELLLETKLFIDERLVSLTQNMLEEGVIYLENIPAGERVIKITGPTIEDFVKEIEVEKDELAKLDIKLEKARGELLVKTEPIGASITVDGRQVEDKTPTLLKLPVGRHEIVVSKDGFKSEEFAIVILKGERKSISLKLEKVSYVSHHYWIQDRQKVWIKGDWEGEKVLYVYYGATDGDPSERWENGDEVFEFWDDFENEESIRKYIIGSGIWKVKNGYLVGYPESKIDCGVLDIILNPKVWSGKDYSVIVKSFSAEVYDKWTGEIAEENLFGTGIAFRVEDIENYWLAKYFNSLAQPPYNYELWRKTNGYFENYIDEVIDFGGSGEDIFQVNVYKEDVELQWNGKEIISFEGIDINQGTIGLEAHCSKFIIDYVIVTKYSPTPPSIEYAPEESGTWQVAGYTFTKRRKVIVHSQNSLEDFQIALDFSKFDDERLMIVEVRK
ncbi:MAG: PEGA domain-containing protein [Thermotogae bacterium]|nr:PEGA domain-containing protein [Thermotogota bacterium]